MRGLLGPTLQLPQMMWRKCSPSWAPQMKKVLWVARFLRWLVWFNRFLTLKLMLSGILGLYIQCMIHNLPWTQNPYEQICKIFHIVSFSYVSMYLLAHSIYVACAEKAAVALVMSLAEGPLTNTYGPYGIFFWNKRDGRCSPLSTCFYFLFQSLQQL